MTSSSPSVPRRPGRPRNVLGNALRHARAGIGRTASSVVAVALGVALVVAFQLMNAAVLESFVASMDAMAGRAALTVGAGEGLYFPEEVVETVRRISGVKQAVPLVRATVFPNDDSGEVLTVQGVDLTREADVRVYHDAANPGQVIDDLAEFLNSSDSIVLGREFAARRGIVAGGTLDLVTPGGVRRFRVRGLLDAQGLAQTLQGRLVVMDLPAAERVFGGDGRINQIDVLVEEGADLGVVAAKIRAAVPAGLKVEEPALRKAVVSRSVVGFQAMLTAFSLLSVLAGFIICYGRLRAVFEARSWEVGLWRAVGMPRPAVVRELLVEALLLGLLGTGAGIVLGILIGRYGLPVLATTTALALRMPPPAAEAVLRYRAVGLGVIVGLAAAVGAALGPAMRLARTPPVEALRLRRREASADASHAHWAIPLLLIAAGTGLIAMQQAGGDSSLGTLATGILALAACTLARPLVTHGTEVLALAWEKLFGTAGRIAARELGRQPRRAGLTVATLGVGLGIVLLLGALEWSFESTVVDQLQRHQNEDLVVSSSNKTAGYLGATMNEGIVDDLAALPGVAVVCPEQIREVPYDATTVVVDSFDTVCFRDQRVFRWPMRGDALPSALERVAAGEAVFVTRAFVRKHGVRPGDTVRLDTLAGPASWIVAGVVDLPPESAVVMNRARYREAWGDHEVTFVFVAAKSDTGVPELRRSIESNLGARRSVLVQTRADIVDFFVGKVRDGFAVQRLLQVAVMVLVLLGIGDALFSGVLERTREFGMLRAVGMSRTGLCAVIVLEGMAIGLLGLVLAVAMGGALGVYWVQVQFPALLGWGLDFHFPAAFGCTAAAAALLLCLLGSLTPAVRAARLPVREALHDE